MWHRCTEYSQGYFLSLEIQLPSSEIEATSLNASQWNKDKNKYNHKIVFQNLFVESFGLLSLATESEEILGGRGMQ